MRIDTSASLSLALALPLGGMLLLPLAFLILLAVDASAWAALADASGLGASLGMTLWTGLASTALSWFISAWLLSHAFASAWWLGLVRRLPALLATPHAAFAVGWVFLIAPSGWLLRAVSPWLTGFQAPPQIATSQDSLGLGLIACLVFKEVPFLLWMSATQLQRDDTAARWQRETLVAQTWGYGRRQAFWLVVWPQLAARLQWPLLAVLAYSLTVVDLALIAGPGSPSTLAVRAWQWLQDSDVATQSAGAAAGWLLTGLVVVCAGLCRWLALRHSANAEGRRKVEGHAPVWSVGRWVWHGIVVAYGMVLLALLASSVAGVWAFPNFWPQTLSWEAWRSVFTSSKTIGFTLGLGLASSLMALIWSVAWLECAHSAWDRVLRRLLYLPLVLPGVLWVVGLHRMALEAGLSGTWVAVLLAHWLAVLPYALIALSPAYLGFDPRYAQVCASLGKPRWAYLLRVKWPLLRQSLLSTFAVGFAVSVAQFLPTLFLGEGAVVTVTTEAVTLSSGGQRSLVAAFAWLQWLLPAIVFVLAAGLGRPRQFAKTLKIPA